MNWCKLQIHAVGGPPDFMRVYTGHHVRKVQSYISKSAKKIKLLPVEKFGNILAFDKGFKKATII